MQGGVAGLRRHVERHGMQASWEVASWHGRYARDAGVVCSSAQGHKLAGERREREKHERKESKGTRKKDFHGVTKLRNLIFRN